MNLQIRRFLLAACLVAILAGCTTEQERVQSLILVPESPSGNSGEVWLERGTYLVTEPLETDATGLPVPPTPGPAAPPSSELAITGPDGLAVEVRTVVSGHSLEFTILQAGTFRYRFGNQSSLNRIFHRNYTEKRPIRDYRGRRHDVKVAFLAAQLAVVCVAILVNLRSRDSWLGRRRARDRRRPS
jgi:hypothetical protein